MAKVMVINAVWIALMGGMLLSTVGLYNEQHKAQEAYAYSQVASVALAN